MRHVSQRLIGLPPHPQRRGVSVAADRLEHSVLLWESRPTIDQQCVCCIGGGREMVEFLAQMPKDTMIFLGLAIVGLLATLVMLRPIM
jgi:hypothetical protein